MTDPTAPASPVFPPPAVSAAPPPSPAPSAPPLPAPQAPQEGLPAKGQRRTGYGNPPTVDVMAYEAARGVDAWEVRAVRTPKRERHWCSEDDICRLWESIVLQAAESCEPHEGAPEIGQRRDSRNGEDWPLVDVTGHDPELGAACWEVRAETGLGMWETEATIVAKWPKIVAKWTPAPVVAPTPEPPGEPVLAGQKRAARETPRRAEIEVIGHDATHDPPWEVLCLRGPEKGKLRWTREEKILLHCPIVVPEKVKVPAERPREIKLSRWQKMEEQDKEVAAQMWALINTETEKITTGKYLPEELQDWIDDVQTLLPELASVMSAARTQDERHRHKTSESVMRAAHMRLDSIMDRYRLDEIERRQESEAKEAKEQRIHDLDEAKRRHDDGRKLGWWGIGIASASIVVSLGGAFVQACATMKAAAPATSATSAPMVAPTVAIPPVSASVPQSVTSASVTDAGIK